MKNKTKGYSQGYYDACNTCVVLLDNIYKEACENGSVSALTIAKTLKQISVLQNLALSGLDSTRSSETHGLE